MVDNEHELWNETFYMFKFNKKEWKIVQRATDAVFKGTLMQIWKSPYILEFI